MATAMPVTVTDAAKARDAVDQGARVSSAANGPVSAEQSVNGLA
jgi:hypothetical protein